MLPETLKGLIFEHDSGVKHGSGFWSVDINKKYGIKRRTEGKFGDPTQLTPIVRYGHVSTPRWFKSYQELRRSVNGVKS